MKARGGEKVREKEQVNCVKESTEWKQITNYENKETSKEKKPEKNIKNCCLRECLHFFLL